jgi:hypothetical protein
MKRRVMSSQYWDIQNGELVKLALTKYNTKPPKGNKRQRKQTGQAKRNSEVYKQKNRPSYRKQLKKQNRKYKTREKFNPKLKLYKKRYNANPQLFKRRPGGGVSTKKQKSQRAEQRRKK